MQTAGSRPQLSIRYRPQSAAARPIQQHQHRHQHRGASRRVMGCQPRLRRQRLQPSQRSCRQVKLSLRRPSPLLFRNLGACCHHRGNAASRPRLVVLLCPKAFRVANVCSRVVGDQSRTVRRCRCCGAAFAGATGAARRGHRAAQGREPVPVRRLPTVGREGHRAAATSGR